MKLPDSRAFVVRLSEQTDSDARLPSGRIEHVESGLSRRIASREELWVFIQTILAQESCDED